MRASGRLRVAGGCAGAAAGLCVLALTDGLGYAGVLPLPWYLALSSATAVIVVAAMVYALRLIWTGAFDR